MFDSGENRPNDCSLEVLNLHTAADVTFASVLSCSARHS